MYIAGISVPAKASEEETLNPLLSVQWPDLKYKTHLCIVVEIKIKVRIKAQRNFFFVALSSELGKKCI